MGILMGAVLYISSKPASSNSSWSPVLMVEMLLISSLFYLLPAAWGILTGFGLLKLKNWARISVMVFSVLLIFMSAFCWVSFTSPIPATPNPEVSPSTVLSIRIGMGVFCFMLLGSGTWLLVFFSRTKVKQQFVQRDMAFAAESAIRPHIGIS